MPRQGALTHINRRRTRRPDSRTFKSLAELRAQVITGFGTGIAAGAAPFLIAAGPDGDLRLIEAADRIVRITPLGVITEFSAGTTAGYGPEVIAAVPEGNL